AQDFTASDGQRVQNFGANVRIFTTDGEKTSWDADVTFTSYYGKPRIRKTFKDGTSNTIVFSTRYANNVATRPGGGAITCSAYDALHLPGVGPPHGAFFGAKTMTGPAGPLSTGGFQLNPPIDKANCISGDVAHSFRKDGILVGLGDGSVRMLSAAVSST